MSYTNGIKMTVTVVMSITDDNGQPTDATRETYVGTLAEICNDLLKRLDWFQFEDGTGYYGGSMDMAANIDTFEYQNGVYRDGVSLNAMDEVSENAYFKAADVLRRHLQMLGMKQSVYSDDWIENNWAGSMV